MVAISLIAFVLLWGVVFAQMVTGGDPVLGDKSSALTSATTKGDHAKETELRVEATRTDADEPTDSDQDEGEASETTDPRELELQQTAEREATEAAEIEAAEVEAAEVEAVEVEPEPVTTSQS